MATNARRRTRSALTLLFALALVFLALGAQPRPVAAGLPRPYEPDELVVAIDELSDLSVEQLNGELGTTTLAELAPGSAVYLLRTPPGVDPDLLAEQIELDPRLRFAEPNYISRAPEANPRGIGSWGGLDPSPLPAQPALAQIGLAAAHTIGRGAGVTVAIIDTGLQLDHPALAGALAPGGYDFVDGDSVPEDLADGVDNDLDGLADEAFGHGTHVAGIVRQVAPEARLLPLRALSAEGDGDAFAVAQAIVYAARTGAGVINLSLGTPASSALLKEAVRTATLAGAVVAAAAGNEATDEKQYPAAAGCAIAVTAVGLGGRPAPFANLGGWVAVAAPGERILSAFPRDGYAAWSGTSMATPFVAGQAALIRALRPALDVRQVADLIGGTARTTPDLVGLLGDGSIDLPASLRAARSGAELSAQHSSIGGSCVTPDIP